MPDPRSVMQEFRTLEAKRLARGLSPEEERRLAELRDLVGGEAGAGAPRGGFDVNAAAARLRESLLPAGLRNRPPPPPELSPEPEPEPFFPAPETAQLADAGPAQAEEAPFAGVDLDAALFDPASLGWEGEDAGPLLDASGQPWDPNAMPLEPSGQPWDPNAVPLDASGQPWDPNAIPVDTSGQPWDPNTVPLDASGQPWDPNAVPLDASGQPWDPNAVPLDASGQPWDPNAVPLDASGQPWDPNAAGLWDPASLAAPDAAPLDGAPPALDAAWDSSAFPAEPEPTRAFGLGDAPPGDPLAGLDLDGAALELEPIDDAGPEVGGLGEAGGSADPGAALAPDERWSVPELDAAMPDGSAFDAAPAPEPTQLLGLASEPEPTLAIALPADGEPLPPAGWDPEPAPALAGPGVAFGTYDELAATGPELAADHGLGALGEQDGGLEPLAHDLGVPVIAPAEGDLGEYDDAAGFAPGATFELPPGADFEVGGTLAAGADAPLELGDAGEWQADGALDPSFALESGGSFDAAADVAEGWATTAAPAPWEAGAPAEPPPLDLDATAGSDADGVTESHPLHPAVPAIAASEPDDLALPEIVEEELPTIDGEDILEEIPADEAGFAAPRLERAPPASAAGAAVPGQQRVVVHTVEGTVKRGVIEDADLTAATIALSPAPGEAAESIPTAKVKAIFFMLAPGEAAPAAEGKKIRVTFRDGRQVAGSSPDYREGGPGFFMIPDDARTNTGRIWVYREAVKQVVVS